MGVLAPQSCKFCGVNARGCLGVHRRRRYRASYLLDDEGSPAQGRRPYSNYPHKEGQVRETTTPYRLLPRDLRSQGRVCPVLDHGLPAHS